MVYTYHPRCGHVVITKTCIDAERLIYGGERLPHYSEGEAELSPEGIRLCTRNCTYDMIHTLNEVDNCARCQGSRAGLNVEVHSHEVFQEIDLIAHLRTTVADARAARLARLESEDVERRRVEIERYRWRAGLLRAGELNVGDAREALLRDHPQELALLGYVPARVSLELGADCYYSLRKPLFTAVSAEEIAGLEEHDRMCGICFGQMQEALALPCRHRFCRSCILSWMMPQNEDNPSCPYCRRVYALVSNPT
jgi:hypothetical protein